MRIILLMALFSAFFVSANTIPTTPTYQDQYVQSIPANEETTEAFDCISKGVTHTLTPEFGLEPCYGFITAHVNSLDWPAKPGKKWTDYQEQGSAECFVSQTYGDWNMKLICERTAVTTSEYGDSSEYVLWAHGFVNNYRNTTNYICDNPDYPLLLREEKICLINPAIDQDCPPPSDNDTFVGAVGGGTQCYQNPDGRQCSMTPENGHYMLSPSYGSQEPVGCVPDPEPEPPCTGADCDTEPPCTGDDCDTEPPCTGADCDTTEPPCTGSDCDTNPPPTPPDGCQPDDPDCITDPPICDDDDPDCITDPPDCEPDDPNCDTVPPPTDCEPNDPNCDDGPITDPPDCEPNDPNCDDGPPTDCEPDDPNCEPCVGLDCGKLTQGGKQGGLNDLFKTEDIEELKKQIKEQLETNQEQLERIEFELTQIVDVAPSLNAAYESRTLNLYGENIDISVARFQSFYQMLAAPLMLIAVISAMFILLRERHD